MAVVAARGGYLVGTDPQPDDGFSPPRFRSCPHLLTSVGTGRLVPASTTKFVVGGAHPRRSCAAHRGRRARAFDERKRDFDAAIEKFIRR